VEPIDVWDFVDVALLRERRDWIWHPNGPKVQLGAGRKHLLDYDNLDYPDWDAHAPEESPRWLIPRDDNSVTTIAIQFTLDHLYPWAVARTLQECQRVLQVGGVINIVVPHYSSQLAAECLFHHSRFGIDTWRNLFSERQYSHQADDNRHNKPWALAINVNFIYGVTERNLCLFTQLVKFEHEEDE
jgi:hypothetical protein